jgi:putative two-component system response regulator
LTGRGSLGPAPPEETTRDAHLDPVQRLALAAEFKDDHTGAHLERGRRYSEPLARGLGLGEAEIADIGHAAPSHDIGKLGIPERILLKPERLPREELPIMRPPSSAAGSGQSRSGAAEAGPGNRPGPP